MIQVGKLRTFYNDEGKKITYFKAISTLKYKTLRLLFDNIEADLKTYLKPEERINLFYTVAHHLEGKRTFTSWQAQDIIPIDLDGIDLDRIDEYPSIVAEALKIDLDKCAVVYSGNGCHILIQVTLWKDKEFIKKAKLGYRQLLDRIVEGCEAKGLPLDKDTTAWDYARVLRVPFTKNSKIKKDENGKEYEVVKDCILVQNNLEAQPLEIPIVEAPRGKFLDKGSFPSADIKTIVSGCEFFKWLKDKPEEVHEPHAYAMLSITGHFDDEGATSKEYWDNFNSPSINSKNLGEFTEQALTASGPRTCEGINDIWGNCESCKHYNKVTSPIMLKDPNHIGTEHLGFTLVTKKGGYKRQYKDLVNWFKREYNYKHIYESGDFYVYDKTHYRPYSYREVKTLAENMFKQPVQEKERVEFLKAVEANDVTPTSFLSTPPTGKINLKNGVLDIKTGVIDVHSKDYNFTYCLPYDYDPAATCPNWDKFLKDVTLGRQDLINILEEYLGYCVYGGEYIYHKALILSGGGKNGKSTFVDVLRKLIGDDNTSNVPLVSINTNPFALAEMQRALVNISEEEPPTCFKETGTFKNLTGNNVVMAQRKFKDPFKFLSKAKIVITYNEMPFISDTSTGMRRRLLVVPFELDLESQSDKVNTNIGNDLEAELSGIFNRALQGYKRLVEKGGFTKSISVENEVKELLENNNSFYNWLNDNCELGNSEHFETVSDLYEDYRHYMEEAGEKNFKTRRKFTQELKKAGVSLLQKKLKGKNVRSTQYVRLVNAASSKKLQF